MEKCLQNVAKKYDTQIGRPGADKGGNHDIQQSTLDLHTDKEPLPSESKEMFQQLLDEGMKKREKELRAPASDSGFYKPGTAKGRFSSMLNAEKPVNTDEAERQANLDKMRGKIEQAKSENANARRTMQEQARQKEERERQLYLARKWQAEYERQSASYDSSSDHDDSTAETLSTIGSVLMGLAQGAAANYTRQPSRSGFSGGGAYSFKKNKETSSSRDVPFCSQPGTSHCKQCGGDGGRRC